MAERVSVALPVYNGAQYLEEQMESILVQLKSEDEVVVAYQRCEDDSLKILQQFQRRDSRVKIYVNHQTGVTANFQLAIERCNGDYIFLSDQDDVWLPEKRDHIAELLRESKADLVVHNAVHTDAALHPQERNFFQIYPIGPGVWHNIVKPRMSGCCMAFTKEFSRKLLPLPEIYGYDQWINVLAECCGKVIYLDEVLLLHRLHGENVTTSTRALSVVLRCRAKLLWSLGLRLLRIHWKG